MKIKVGELIVIVPFSCIFEDQKQYLDFLYLKFQKEGSAALEIPQSETQNIILISFLIACLSSRDFMMRKASQECMETQPTIFYLPKTNRCVEFSIEKAKEIQIMRQKEIPDNYTHINIVTRNTNKQATCTNSPTLSILTQLQFLSQIRDNECLFRGRVIIYFSQISTLDTDCQNTLCYQITQTTLRKAILQKRYLDKKVCQPSLEGDQYQYKQLLANKKQDNKAQFLNYHILLINMIQYIIGFLKSKQKQYQSNKIKKSIPKRLTEVIAEWTKELVISESILDKLLEKFLEIVVECKIPKEKVESILLILEFINNLVVLSEKYEEMYPNSFRCFINLKSEQNELFSLQLCCLQPRIIFNRIYYFPKKQKFNCLTLLLSSSTPIHPDFFLNNFHHTFQTKTIFCPQIYHRNILSMMVNSNAFVDLKSDDYDSQIYLQIQRSFGTLIIEFADVITDGIVVYISSVKYMAALIEEWKKENIIENLGKKKYVFFESEKEEENKVNIGYFKEACDVGKGAIFFFSCRSKAAEVEKLMDHYSNAIIFIGYPKINENFLRNKQKLDHLKSNENYWKDEFLYLEEEAMRHVNKCLANCFSHKKMEKKVIIFADSRFNSRLLPSWVTIDEGNLNINEALERSVNFLRHNFKKEITSVLTKGIYYPPQI